MTLDPAGRREDARLVREASDGSQAAFSELVRRHRDRWYTLAYRLLGNADAAADVTQEVAIRAWRGLGGFRGDAAFSTWTHRIVVNTAWSQRRSVRRHRAEPLDHVDDPAHDPLEFHADRLGLRQAVSDAVMALSPANRAMVVLKDVYGWSHTEAAEALGITVTAAKVRLHRGRAALRRSLEGEL